VQLSMTGSSAGMNQLILCRDKTNKFDASAPLPIPIDREKGKKMADTKVWFEIHGNLVTRHEETVDRSGDGERMARHSQTKKFEAVWEELQKLQPQISFTPHLTEGRWIGKAEWRDKTCVVVEYPPQVRKVVANFSSYGGRRLFEMAFPHIIFGFRFSGVAVDAVQVYYRNQPIVSLDDELHCPNLHNIYGPPKCNVCTGDLRVDVGLPLPERVNALVQAFWGSEFSSDLASHNWVPSKELEGHPQKYSEWEERSKEDPNFILSIDWRKTGWTVNDLLRKGVGQK